MEEYKEVAIVKADSFEEVLQILREEYIWLNSSKLDIKYEIVDRTTSGLITKGEEF